MHPIVAHIEQQLRPIPAGSILMQDNRIAKRWSVSIAPLLIGAFQITTSTYMALCGDTDPDFEGRDLPITSVSWLQAASFCNALSQAAGLECCYHFHADNQDADRDPAAKGYRLPTEAEWEYACRAGSNEPRYGPLPDIAWYSENSAGRPQAVGTKRPNDWGLYDMLGNVWEWCSDIYDAETYGRYRSFRGGGWADEERGCLATNGRRSHPTFAIDDLGFRIVRPL